MSKLEEKIEFYVKEMQKIESGIDKELLFKIAKNLGPALYRKSSEVIKCETRREKEKIRINFLQMKLGIDKDVEVLDKAIAEVCKKTDKLKERYRVIFYYLLVKQFKKENLFV